MPWIPGRRRALSCGFFASVTINLPARAADGSARIVADSVLRRPDDDAPVSNLFLFGRKQDLAFEQPVGGGPRRRHHLSAGLAVPVVGRSAARISRNFADFGPAPCGPPGPAPVLRWLSMR